MRGRGRGRGRGRPRKYPKVEEEDVSMEDSGTADETDKTENEETDTSKDDSKSTPTTGPRKRGRKRKSEIVRNEEKYDPTAETAKRGIVASGGSLRRRETLKSSWRYSPPPVSTRKYGPRSSTTPSRYMEDGEFKDNDGRKSEEVSVDLEYVQSEDKLVVTLPDGSNLKVDPYKKPIDEMDVDEDDGEKDKDSKDPDYKPGPGHKIAIKSDPARITDSDKMKTSQIVKVSNQVVNQSAVRSIVSPSATVSISTNPIKTQFNTPLAKVPSILKPTGTTKSTTRRSLSLTKYLDTLPEINECIHNDGIDDSQMEKLPDKILLVHSELPLPLAVSIDKEDQNYLFRQIISPVNATRYVCLLCKGIEVNFGTKEEKDILLHYQSLHELDVDIGHAKFSEDIVFICLPKMILNQFNSSTALSLNSPCQYCDTRLSDIVEMKEHYSVEHQKKVIMMEQEEIMKMHHLFYCCKCKLQSQDFDSHHKHMKTEHQLKTYRCKSCVLVTQDQNRLRTHYKAKHMLHNAGQNYQCYYCHGLLIGVERLQKHIQQSHMVQTGAKDFSCIACRNSCGVGKELLNHAQNCSLAGIKPAKTDNKFVPVPQNDTPPNPPEVDCFLCGIRLEDEEAYNLHLHHEHKIWTMASDPKEVLDKTLTIDDMITDEQLEKAKIQTYVGHWCRICDQMVKVYQLYYLHMANHHKYTKSFQCVISKCKAQFQEFAEFKKHIEETGHSQKTIISHPDEVSVCTYCDLYLSTDEELINHLITDQHINKFTASGHFHRTEPRNFKCKACHTFFGMKESYIHHLETESHQYVCTYCGITTATPSSRRAHIQNTHPEKLLSCEDCGENHADILAHFVFHGYTFECKKCVKKFYNRERLNAHMEVHQDPIECSWADCGRMIATRSMLVTHYRGHKSEHKCTTCGQAFWNLAMLTSHMRSHQPIPRTPQANKANQYTKSSPMNYSGSNASHRLTPSVLQRQRGNQSVLNSVIKCGHCHNLFRSTKELGGHKCVAKFNVMNNGDQKLMDLANRAEQAKTISKPTPQRRRASPKKPVQIAPSVQEQMLDVSSITQTSGENQNADEDTQLIMILNQSTGELMEITAPKGMEVQDVINSLNFSQSIEDVQVETVEEPAATQQVNQIVQPKIENTEQETAQAIEIIEQQANQENPTPEVTATEQATASIMIEEKTQQPAQQLAQIIDNVGEQEQAIVLPADCFNEDGSLTLDAATLSRLNLSLQVDENGGIATSDPNAATFIIDTSSIKE